MNTSPEQMAIDKVEISDLDKRRILRAIEASLLAKGFVKSSNPDLLVSMFTKSREQINVWNNGQSNISAICDVDWNQASKAFDFFPKAKRFKDYRKMLERKVRQSLLEVKEQKEKKSYVLSGLAALSTILMGMIWGGVIYIFTGGESTVFCFSMLGKFKPHMYSRLC